MVESFLILADDVSTLIVPRSERLLCSKSKQHKSLTEVKVALIAQRLG